MLAHAERRAQLSQRRQGAGVERAAGHAAAADARPHHDARAEEPDEGAGDRLRRGRDGRRGVDRSDWSRTRPSPRSSRSCRASCPPTSPSTTSTSSRNPKVKVHLDDARHYLLTTNEKFDAITSDPLDPWVKGAATLYTREFFQRREGAPQSGRRGDAVRAALREHARRR